MLPLLVLTLCATASLALYPSTSSVIELTPQNFDKLVVNSDDVWLVEFFAPWCGHCQSLVPDYTKAANALRGVVKVGAVDADQHKELGGRYGVRGFPTIKIFGVNKQKPEDLTGGRTADALAQAALRAVRAQVNARLGLSGGGGGSESSGGGDDDVVELTDSNFDRLVMQSDDMWLVEFFAPWCGHCKNLEPHWRKAAAQLKGKVKLGALDATVHQAQASKYGIQGYPTIKYFAAGKKTADSAEDYQAGRTASDIVTWALDKFTENSPAPDIVQLVGAVTLDEACTSKPLCVVAILPHILDCQAQCRNGYVAVLRELGEKFKSKLWGWTWSEAGAQPALEEALELGGFGYPAMAVLNAKKMKYSVLRGPFSLQGINEFLRDLSYGRGNTAPVKGQSLPTVDEIAPWDGQDAAPPQEDDIDLSDVDLDEKEEL